MRRALDSVAGVLLFLVSAYSAWVAFFGLPLAFFFGDQNAAYVIVGAGVIGVLSALGLPWRRRVSAGIGVTALGTVSLALLSVRILPGWTLNFDWYLVEALAVLGGIAGLVYWRFWSVGARSAPPSAAV